MGHNTEILRNTGSFRVRGGSILLSRVGPANGQRQTHNRVARDLVTGERAEWDATERGDYAASARRAPARRGFWAFPYPFGDAFFYAHVWDRHMPKAFRRGAFDWENADEAAREAHLAAHERATRAARRMLRPKLVWCDGPFFGRIRPRGMVGERSWWRYENARDFVESARSQLWCWHPGTTGPWRVDYGADHLEIFVPD